MPKVSELSSQAIQQLIDAYRANVRTLITPVYNVKGFGAKGDGVTDDAAAINAADEAAAETGGIVFYPPGTYAVGFHEMVRTHRVAINVSSGVYHVGSGIGATTVRLSDGADSHVFFFDSSTDAGVQGMKIDGNRDNQTVQNPSTENDPGGVILTGVVSRISLRDLHIQNTPDYGIGVEVGTATDCLIEHVILENVGADGIDAKNTLSNSAGNLARDIVVRNMNPSIGQDPQEAGVNVRGGWILDNIRVFDLTDDLVGIRFNAGETTDPGGLGGHGDILTNFYIEAKPNDGGTSIGVMADSRNCSITNGTILNTHTGIQIRQEGNNISNIYIKNVGNDGIGTSNVSIGEGAGNAIANVTVEGASDVGFQIRNSSNRLVNCIARSCGNRGVVIDPGVEDTSIIGGEFTDNANGAISDNGTGTVIQNVFGIKTENRVASESFALDATGVTSLNIAHGLDFTPDQKDCQLSIQLDSPAEDFVIGFLGIRSITSTNVGVKVAVTTASATVGATAKVVLYTKVKS